MDTFNPYNRAIKETINVDFRDRHSAQKVILCNRENRFYGEFIGTMSAENVNINKGMLTNVSLSNVVILYGDGEQLYLSSITDKISEFEATLDNFKEVVLPSILSIANSVSSQLSSVELSIYQLGTNLSDAINFEVS